MSALTLDPDRIIATAEKLASRIGERFPGSGLSRVGSDLVALSRATAKEARALHGPIIWLRLCLIAGILLGAAVFLFVGTIVSFDRISTGAFQDVQGIEASINTLILASVGIYSLVQLEERTKRKRVFRGLHGLRSIIHVIDMHQLTKDPAALSQGFQPTASSPERKIANPADLARYLDYCSEMLSITGKLAALYAQSVDDKVVIEAVNTIEELGSNLSRKIWQKIMLISGAR